MGGRQEVGGGRWPGSPGGRPARWLALACWCKEAGHRDVTGWGQAPSLWVPGVSGGRDWHVSRGAMKERGSEGHGVVAWAMRRGSELTDWAHHQREEAGAPASACEGALLAWYTPPRVAQSRCKAHMLALR